MKLQTNRSASGTGRRKKSAGFSLMEAMTALVIGVVVVGGIAVTCVYTERNFIGMTNYVNMENQSRNALDLISKDIRNASALVAFSTNNPIYLELTNATAGTLCTITFDTNTSVLTITNGGVGSTNLTGCGTWSFSLYNRAPNLNAFSNDITFYPATNFSTGQLDPTLCKLISLNWKCSRTILGQKLNTEDVQTAQVVLRNQISN